MVEDKFSVCGTKTLISIRVDGFWKKWVFIECFLLAFGRFSKSLMAEWKGTHMVYIFPKEKKNC